MSKFNQFQTLVANKYDGGENSHVENIKDVKNVGDGLFTFVMVELADSEDCNNKAIALERLEKARDQLEELVDAITDMPDEDEFEPEEDE